MKQKTILMNVFDSNMVRNILRTEVLSTLRESPEVGHIVILVHPTKVDAYRAEFASGKVEIEPCPLDHPSRAELMTWFLVRHTIHSKNVRAKINEVYFNGTGNWFVRFSKYVVSLAAYNASKVPTVDRLLRALAYRAHQAASLERVLDRYKPDLVFMPTIFATNDIRLLKACVEHSVPTVGMIKSWDNLLGKDPLLIWPDRLVVHNEKVRELAITMRSYPSERIFISGVPQMDVYVKRDFLPSREDFFAANSLDPAKKLIVYSAVGQFISFHEVAVIRFLTDLVHSGALEEPCQLLVRLHPAYPTEDEEIRKIPGIVIVRPGSVGAENNPLRFDFEFQEGETRELAATLRYADVLIQSGSTMAIDAACFDTPIISAGFDGLVQDRLERSARRLLVKDHFRWILDTGGTAAVYSPQECVDAINRYLKDRTLDHDGRMRIVSEQVYRLDGKSGERIGQYVLRCLSDLVPRP